MDHEAYLERVERALEKAETEVADKVVFRENEITKMQEYFWESYAEYDEYGYEQFDNARVYREEIDAQRELLNKYKRIKKMKDSPYFAAVSFCYEGEDEPEDYYIGIGDFSPKRGDVPMVCDWRAPISGLFYDYDRGEASFDAPAGTMHGQLRNKYQFKIKKGKLLYAVDTETSLHDDILHKELSMNATARLKSIVSTIQKEQNAIIRNEKDRILVIQGSAGSGKTSVALHRIAYLLYHHRNTLSASQILILSPNPVFSEYISHILPELGEENILEMSLDLYAYRKLKNYGEAEDKYDYLEKLLSMENEAAKEYAAQVQYRQSEEFTERLQYYVLSLEDDLLNFRELHFKKLHREPEQIRELFYEKFPDIPLLARMKTVGEYIIDEEETLTGKEYDDVERSIIIEKLEKMYVQRNVRRLYESFLEQEGLTMEGNVTAFGKKQADGQKDEEQFLCQEESESIAENGEAMYQGSGRMLAYADVYPLLYLRYLLYGFPAQKQMKHLLIDEMQDYSYLQMLLVSRMFSCPMTILGDREQALEPGKRNTREICRKVFGKQITYLELTKSYRSTMEIMKFANHVAGIEDGELFERYGKEVEYFCEKTEQNMLERLEQQLKKQNSEEYATTAVLTKNAKEAQQIYEALKEKMPISLLTTDTDKMECGVVVAPFYLVKGLEFDSVHLAFVDHTYETVYHRQILYIGATRALHEVTIYGVGRKCCLFETD